MSFTLQFIFLEKDSFGIIFPSQTRQIVTYAGAVGNYPMVDFINGPNANVTLDLSEAARGDYAVHPFF